MNSDITEFILFKSKNFKNGINFKTPFNFKSTKIEISVPFEFEDISFNKRCAFSGTSQNKDFMNIRF